MPTSTRKQGANMGGKSNCPKMRIKCRGRPCADPETRRKYKGQIQLPQNEDKM